MRSGRVCPSNVVGVTGESRPYRAIVLGAPGMERVDCPHSQELDSLAVVRWQSCTAEVWLCRDCHGLVYQTTWTSPGWVSTKARITGELTLKAFELAEDRRILRQWAKRARQGPTSRRQAMITAPTGMGTPQQPARLRAMPTPVRWT